MAAWQVPRSSLFAQQAVQQQGPAAAQLTPCRYARLAQLDLPSTPTSATSCCCVLGSPSLVALPLPSCAPARPLSFELMAAPGGGSLQYS